MARIPAGSFLMGSEDEDVCTADGKCPIREVNVSKFDGSPAYGRRTLAMSAGQSWNAVLGSAV